MRGSLSQRPGKILVLDDPKPLKPALHEMGIVSDN
jgi:hypothetical protein